MKTIGYIALAAWVALIVFSMILPLTPKGQFYRWLFQRRRKLQLVILTLMITWMSTLVLSGVFKVD